jgi:hypothetical protein
LVAIALGWIAVRSERHTAAARLAFETVRRTNWDQDYIEKRREFLSLRDSEKGLEIYTDKAPPGMDADEFSRHRAAIFAILNDRENTAIGIRRGILDEEYLYRYTRTGLIDDWDASSALITAWRRQRKNPMILVEFEGLAAQWRNNMSYRQRYLRRDRRMPERKRVVSIQ